MGGRARYAASAMEVAKGGRVRAWIRWLAMLAFCLSLLLGQEAWAQTPRIAVLEVRGPITPVVAGYLERGLRAANDQRHAAVLVRLDTPGGLDTAMRDIVQAFEASHVPVIAYVAPPGARAASAGAFITMAAHVAAMAPNTAIGAASPVGGGGEEIQGTMKAKVTNDAAAYLRGIAKSRGRNAQWAERAVRESISASAEEAVQLKVVDLVAPDVPTLLDRIDGRKVKVGDRTVTLQTAHADRDEIAMQPVERLLQSISDPTIALLLLNLGMLGLFFELSNPGLIVPGVVGGICLLLALFALGTLPINAAGIALIGLAFLLFIAELFVPSFGALAVGGVISMVLGALMLVAPGTPGFEVSRPLIATIAASFGLLMAGLGVLAVRAQRRRATTGVEGMIGTIAEVRRPLDPEGQVFTHGELWRAISLEGTAPAGSQVRIERIQDLTLYVVPLVVETPPSLQEAPPHD